MHLLDTKRIATSGLLFILSAIVLFHLLVLLGVVPWDIVWAGRLQDASQMLVFETISIGVNLLMLAVVSIYAGILKVNLHPTVIKAALWVMFAIFLLNTVGNMLSNNEMEKIVFTPLTLLLSLFSLRLAISKEKRALA